MYHRLPPPIRDAAATVQGWRLRSWRFGPETDRLVAEALERDRWGPAQWDTWRAERVAQLLHRAATRVPYYRALWAERRRRGDRASWDVLEHWPVLSKDALRATPEAFVADDADRRRLFRVHTSGTSGTPLTLWRPRESGRAWYALMEARMRAWHGVSRHEPWAVLGGQVVVAPDARRPPFWVWNAAGHQLYLSANHVSAAHAPAYREALAARRVTHLVTYASSAAALGAAFTAAGLAAPGLRVIFTNAEPVSPDQRATIARGLGAPVRETYGMVETVAGASECEHGRLHLWPDVGLVELLDDTGRQAVHSGQVGQVVATGLLNPDMPLIRYAVGDRMRLAAAGAACACGRSLPVIDAIEGRTNDLLRAPDGRLVFWLNPVFYGLPLREAQIVQETLTELRVRFVPSDGYTEGTLDEVRGRLRDRMGDVEVRFEQVDSIPRGPNGKFRAVECRVQATPTAA